MNKKERRLALATALQSATSTTTLVEDLKVRSTTTIIAKQLPKYLCESKAVVVPWLNLATKCTALLCLPLVDHVVVWSSKLFSRQACGHQASPAGHLH